MIKNSISLYFIFLLITLVGFIEIFFNYSFLIEKDSFRSFEYFNNLNFGGEKWRPDRIFGVSAIFGDPGANSYFSLYNTLTHLFKTIDRIFFYDLTICILLSFSIYFFFKFINFLSDEKNDLIYKIIFSSLILFSPLLHEMYSLRLWISIIVIFPILSLLLLKNKVNIYNYSLLISLSLVLGSLSSAISVLLGFFFLISVFIFSNRNNIFLKLKDLFFLNLYSVFIICAICSFVLLPIILETFNMEYIRKKNYDFSFFNLDLNFFLSLFHVGVFPKIKLPDNDLIITESFNTINAYFPIIFIYYLINFKKISGYEKKFFIFYLIYLIHKFLCTHFPIYGNLPGFFGFPDTHGWNKLYLIGHFAQFVILFLFLSKIFNKNNILEKKILNNLLILFFAAYLSIFILFLSIKFFDLNLINLINILIKNDLILFGIENTFERINLYLGFSFYIFYISTLLIFFYLYTIINYGSLFISKNLFILLLLINAIAMQKYIYPLSNEKFIPFHDSEGIPIFQNDDINIYEKIIFKKESNSISKNLEDLKKTYYIPRNRDDLFFKDSILFNQSNSFSGKISHYPKNQKKYLSKKYINGKYILDHQQINFDFLMDPINLSFFSEENIKFIYSEKEINSKFLDPLFKNKYIYLYENKLSLPFYYLMDNKETDICDNDNNLVTLKEYKADFMLFEYDIDECSKLIIRDAWHPLWNAKLANRDKDMILSVEKFDDIFKKINLPKGKYQLELYFKIPIFYYLGYLLTILTLLIVIKLNYFRQPKIYNFT